jgi:hypothetical protein
MIVDELDCERLVQAFTVLAERTPDAADRRNGLFRRCCEILVAEAHAATPTRGLSTIPSRPNQPSVRIKLPAA